MLSSHLLHTLQMHETTDFGRPGRHLPVRWVEQAIGATGKASIRRRRLPAEQVVWLVIALALYRHQSISEVVDTLYLALPDKDARFVCKSAIAQARGRVGQAPLQWLFRESARCWIGQQAKEAECKGLALLAMDGTTFRTQDSPENRAHFGAQRYVGGRVASYPQVRAVSLTAIPTHLVCDIAFGAYGINEMLYAKTLLERIPDQSLTVFDKGFLAAEILLGLSQSGQERHFLIPAKSNTRWEVLEGSANDFTVRMRVSDAARKNNPALPRTWMARAVRTLTSSGKSRILLTSLTDRRRFRAADIVACYNRRWEIETSYRELKQSMLGCALTLRSRLPEGVHQEIWGALIAYNIVRMEMAQAAREAKVKPTDLSFVRAFHIVQHEMMWAAVTSPGKLPAHLRRLRLQLQFAMLEKRRGRSRPRVVKALPNRYCVRYLKRDLN